SKAEAKCEWEKIRGHPVIGSMVISDFDVDLSVALAELVGKASSDIFTKGVITSASGDDSHRADRAAIPPGPVGITDNAQTWSCSFTRSMVPTDPADAVSAEMMPKIGVNHRVKGPRILARAGAGSLKVCEGCGIDR